MAEYKKFSCPQGDDFEGGDECDRCDQYEICMETPTADVIERSKVDKAIEEIKEVSFKHYFEQGEYIGEITEQWEVVKLDHVIDILRRNIGE